MKFDRLRQALRNRQPVRDEDFDALLPLAYRRLSPRFWTPLRAARRAAQWLEGEGARRVLDVGAGVGKFCTIGALSTDRARFIGVEHREALVRVASEVIDVLGAHRATVLHGSLEDVDPSAYDAFYFFNPFVENIICSASRVDSSVNLSKERHGHDVRIAERLLANARVGTNVVTYFGYGGRMPYGYHLVHEERHGGPLRLWFKDAPTPARAYDAPAGRKPAR